MKTIERALQVIQEKKNSPLTVNDLLSYSVIEVVSPNLRKLLLLYLQALQSKSVIERSFSCMKMIMINKRINFDSGSLVALTCLSHRNKFFSAGEVNNVIEI